jgi:hypothetical protein
MSARNVYMLTCDAPGCKGRFTDDRTRADETHMYAAREGWSHGRVPPAPNRGGRAQSLDYCPAHAKLGEELSLPPLPMHAREANS